MASTNKSLSLTKKKKKKKKSSKTVCVVTSTDVEYVWVPCGRGWEFVSYLRLLCSCPELITVPATDTEGELEDVFCRK